MSSFFFKKHLANLLALTSLSLGVEQLQASTLPGKYLPPDLSNSCASLEVLTITNNDSAGSAESIANQAAPASCSQLQFDSAGSGTVSLTRSLSLGGSSVYLTSAQPNLPTILDMNGETLAISTPAYLTVSPDVYFYNTNFVGSATNLTFEGKTENWEGINQITMGNSIAIFNITDPDSNTHRFPADVNVEPVIFGELGMAMFALQSLHHRTPAVELPGTISDMGLPCQVTFGGTQDAIDSYNPTFILSGENNSWSGGSIIQGAHLIIKNSGALPPNGDIHLALGSASALPTLTFTLADNETYDAMGTITGDTWGSIEVTTGNIHFQGDISSNNLVLRGGITQLSGSNALQTVLMRPGAVLQVSSTDNLYNAPSNYQYTVLEGGTLELLSNGLLEFTEASSPTLRTGSTDTPFTISTGDNARTIFSILQVEQDSALAIEGTGETSIERMAFLDTGNSINLSVSGSLTGNLAIQSYTQARNTFTFAPSPSASLSEAFSTEEPIFLNYLSISGNIDVSLLEDFRALELELESAASLFIFNTLFVDASIWLTEASLHMVDLGSIINAELVSVGLGATLAGTGTLNVPTTHIYGTLSPGSSPTNMTINGNIFLYPDAQFSEYIEPGACATLTVQEGLAIDPDVSLKIRALPGCYARSGENFTFVEANSVSGRFDSIDMNTVMLTSTVSYTEDSITLHVMPTALTSIAKNGNAHTIAQNIDENLDSGNTKLCNLITGFFPLSRAEIGDILEDLQPSELTAVSIIQEDAAVKVRDSLSYRFEKELNTKHCRRIKNKETDDSSCSINPKSFHAWTDGFGSSLHQNKTHYGQNTEVGYQNNMAGVSAGVDYNFSKYFYAGVLGAYTYSKLHYGSSLGSASAETGYAGLYMSAITDMAYVNASVIGGWSHYTTKRNIFSGSSSPWVAKGSTGGAQLLSHIDTGICLGTDFFSVRPFDSFDYISQTQNVFSEHGSSPANLSILKNNAILIRNELGLSFAGCFCVGRSQWTVSPKVSWVREVRVKGGQVNAEFVGTNIPFTVSGYFPDRSLVSPGVSLSGSMMEDLLTLTLYYNGEFKGNYSDHSYGGQIRFGF